MLDIIFYWELFLRFVNLLKSLEIFFSYSVFTRPPECMIKINDMITDSPCISNINKKLI